MRKKILIVDDEMLERKRVIEDLEEFDFEIFEADKIRKALKILSLNNIDIMILDRKIGIKEDGLNICNRINEKSDKYGNPLIIVLSRKISELDVTTAYRQSEFDFYVRKPYVKYELIGLIKKYLKNNDDVNKLNYYDLKLNIENEILYYKEEEILLSHLEFSFLYILFKNIDKIISKEKIYNFCWKSEEVNTEKLKTLVYRVKLKHPLLKEKIKVQKGIGYRLTI